MVAANEEPRTKGESSESMDSQTSNSDTKPTQEQKKGTLVTKSFTLPRRMLPKRTFKCSIENCYQSFGFAKDLNQHHRDNHPAVKCDLCTEQFSCPNKMLKHKYKHYEIMYECAECECGFTFESQFKAHKMKHRKSLGNQCLNVSNGLCEVRN